MSEQTTTHEAESAREAHRDASGRFGVQPATEADVDLPQPGEQLHERDTMSTLDTAVDTARLPTGVHAEISSVDQPRPESGVIVWADPARNTCDTCGQPWGQEASQPAILQQWGEWADLDRQHGCGTWKDVIYRTLGEDATRQDIERVAAEVACARAEAIQAERDTTRARLVEDLTEAVTLRDAGGWSPQEGEDEGDSPWITGSEIDSGVVLDYAGEGLMAWDYGPVDGDEIIIVQEADLS